MGEKYLSDVIDYDRHIKPYQLIQIYSGVGSGKNYWVGTLADDGHDILMITSRKATADAQALKIGATRFINIDEMSDKKESNKQNLCVCTNRGIERFVKTIYDINNPKTHIWNYFDLIILDEAHSLVSDATFLESPFHVMKFLRHVQDEANNCKLIFMTGTPEPIDWIVSEETKSSEEYNHIDCYKDCIHVEPEEVVLYPYEDAASEIIRQLEQHKNERIIYFANRIEHIRSLVSKLQKHGVPEEVIGISYSNNDQNSLFSNSLLEKRDRIRESLVKEERVPQDIRIFITTTQNKEGINIIDDDIKIMFSESTQRTELIQMAGRVRTRLGALIVLYDTPNYLTPITHFEAIRDKKCVKQMNEAIEEFFEIPDMYSHERLQQVISNVEKLFPNIRFNYFTLLFSLYQGKVKGNEQTHVDACYIRKCVNFWSKAHADSIQPENGVGAVNLQKWFPYSDCSRLFTMRPLSERKRQLNSDVQALLEKGKCLDVVISTEQRDNFTVQLNDLLSKHDTKKLQISYPIKSLGPALKKLGYCIKPSGKHDRSGGWIIRTLEESN